MTCAQLTACTPRPHCQEKPLPSPKHRHTDTPFLPCGSRFPCGHDSAFIIHRYIIVCVGADSHPRHRGQESSPTGGFHVGMTPRSSFIVHHCLRGSGFPCGHDSAFIIHRSSFQRGSGFPSATAWTGLLFSGSVTLTLAACLLPIDPFDSFHSLRACPELDEGASPRRFYLFSPLPWRTWRPWRFSLGERRAAPGGAAS